MNSREQENWGIIGNSDKIKEVLLLIRKVADTDVPVMILGESGTGKEIVARAIHETSSRRLKQMLSVNCGAIPEGILESELFGHEKGSFTGAISKRIGYFETANDGTIFLDEIGEMIPQTQVKLLRVLELGEFFRVGGAQVQKTNARVIAATNKDLEREVYKGNFRQDLFYRLKSVTITLPPLRERGSDIELLIKEIIKQLEEKYRIKQEGIAPEVIERFYRYEWPGNIRELKNLLESLVLLKKGGKIELVDLPENIRTVIPGMSGLPVKLNKTSEQVERELIYGALLGLRSDVSDLKNLIMETFQSIRKQNNYRYTDQNIEEVSQYADFSDESFDELSVEKIETNTIQEALRRFNGNRRMAAKALGVSERTLYRRLKKL